jgi:hypothetical protein
MVTGDHRRKRRNILDVALRDRTAVLHWLRVQVRNRLKSIEMHYYCLQHHSKITRTEMQQITEHEGSPRSVAQLVL